MRRGCRRCLHDDIACKDAACRNVHMGGVQFFLDTNAAG
jgi:hypothetical protein